MRPIGTLHMIIGPQEGMQALGVLAHVRVGLAGRIIPLVVLARAWESGESVVDAFRSRL